MKGETMNLWFKQKEESEIQKLVQKYAKRLNELDDPEQEREAMEMLKDAAEVQDKVEDPEQKINPNTVLTILGSLATVGLIIFNEKYLVLNTKSWPFVPKIFGK